MKAIYLDYNATTPMWPSVKQAMLESFDVFGNPSSVHALGRQAQGIMETARLEIADSLSVHPAQVLFTGSGSEANNMVLASYADAHVVTSTTEHSSVLEASKWGARIPVNHKGIIDLKLLERGLVNQKTALLSVMMANNETGVIQDLKAITSLAHSHRCRVHSDCVPALGKIPINFRDVGVDYMTISAHKLGGPKGIGALILREDAPLSLLIRGGGQERRRRAGTENIAAIVGFAAAIKEMQKLSWSACEALRETLEKQLVSWGFTILGEGVARLPNTVCFYAPQIDAQSCLMKYDLAGIALSSGSACSSGKVKASHVAEAMGVKGDTLRVSLGWQTTAEDVAHFLAVTQNIFEIHTREAA